MIEQDVTIVNPLGMHARPAAKVVRLAATFQSHVEMEHDGQTVNAKSIMGVMTLAAECGAQVRIRVDGPDEGAAMASLVQLVESGFGE